jgi:hypothetical protein
MSNKERKFIRFVYKAFFGILTVVGYAVVFVTALEFVSKSMFKELASVLLPVLAVFFGFSALLYNRSRAYPDGPIQRRSLYVAEEAMQATFLYLTAILLGGVITWWVIQLGVKFEEIPASPMSSKMPGLGWLIVYGLPLFLMGLSFITFSSALRVVGQRLFFSGKIRKRLNRMIKNK